MSQQHPEPVAISEDRRSRAHRQWLLQAHCMRVRQTIACALRLCCCKCLSNKPIDQSKNGDLFLDIALHPPADPRIELVTHNDLMTASVGRKYYPLQTCWQRRRGRLPEMPRPRVSCRCRGTQHAGVVECIEGEHLAARGGAHGDARSRRPARSLAAYYATAASAGFSSPKSSPLEMSDAL